MRITIYREDAGQQQMPDAWHLSREIQICDKAHQRGRTQARVLTGDARQLRLVHLMEGLLTTMRGRRTSGCLETSVNFT